MALGHPKGLFPLFFIEMWERLAFYTMLNVLLLYATDFETGGLGLTSAEGNEIYGLYLAFVYFTPFLGGMIADRYFGYRKSVVLGGLLMAGGLFAMGIDRNLSYLSIGLIGLCLGNGFFKPNISVMVGNLYEAGDAKRDAGFNIFYMGINIGAFIASFLSAGVRNNYGWLWTFWVAGAGLLIGLVILFFNWGALERADRQPEVSPDDTSFKEIIVKILLPAFGVGVLAAWAYAQYAGEDPPLRPPVVGFLAGMVPVIIFFVRMGLTAKEEEKPGLLSLLPIYVAGGTFFMVLHLNGSAMTQWARDNTDRAHVMADAFKTDGLPNYYTNAGPDLPRPDPRSLLVVEDEGLARMYGLQRMDEAAVARVVTEAGEGIALREFELEPESDVRELQPYERSTQVYETGAVELSETVDHGQKSYSVELREDGLLPIKRVAFVRTIDQAEVGTYVVSKEQFAKIYDGYRERYGKEPELLPPGQYVQVVNSEIYQSLNALFVVAFTPLVVMFFARRRKITTAQKVFIGMCLTSLSLLIMAIGGFLSDNGSIKVSALWLCGFYAIVTIGELCLSPMGLSLVTKLTPKRLVGLAMGGWFMATAFGNNLSGFFGGIQGLMEPSMFFLVLAGMAAVVAFGIFLLLPKLDAAIKKYGA